MSEICDNHSPVVSKEYKCHITVTPIAWYTKADECHRTVPLIPFEYKKVTSRMRDTHSPVVHKEYECHRSVSPIALYTKDMGVASLGHV